MHTMAATMTGMQRYDEFKHLQEALIQHGLNKQTAASKQGRAVIEALAALSEDERQEVVLAALDDLYNEAERLVESMRDMYAKYDTLAGITDQLSNDKCRDALILWREMMGFYLNYAHSADPAEGAKAISYILYAVFGGQARGNNSSTREDSLEEF